MLLKAMNAGKLSTFLIQSPRNNDPNVHNPLLFHLYKGGFSHKDGYAEGDVLNVLIINMLQDLFISRKGKS